MKTRLTCFLTAFGLMGVLAVIPVSGKRKISLTRQRRLPRPHLRRRRIKRRLRQTTPAATPAPAPTWSIGPIDFSGTLDGYYSWNTEHPASKTNELYNFDTPTNTFSLNMAKLAMSHCPIRSVLSSI